MKRKTNWKANVSFKAGRRKTFCILLFFSFITCNIAAESITGFQELQLGAKLAEVEKNVKDNEKGVVEKQYKVFTSLKNFPLDGLFVSYKRPDDSRNRIYTKSYYVGNKGAEVLYQVWILWERYDDEYAKEFFSTNSGENLAEIKARELAVGLEIKYGIKYTKINNAYLLNDTKMNNVLMIEVIPANQDLKLIFGNEAASKKGYYISVTYINQPLWGLAEREQKREQERAAENAARKTGL